MDSDKVNPTCEFCHKQFASISSRNRHLKDFHQTIIKSEKNQHILCPMCPKEEKLSSHKNLITHLNQIHEVNCTESILHFRNIKEFEAWRKLENREVDYACHRKTKSLNGDEHIYYNCNRSDSKGYISTCQKRSVKSGGSIKIRGICPARIAVKIFNEELVTATFIETHVGHADELRTKRLTKSQQNIIVEQLTAGVSNDRIIKDARKVKVKTLERLNLITRGDLAYLIGKYNIDGKRDADDMTATALKVEEWNKDGQNHAFLFKKLLDEIVDEKMWKRIVNIERPHANNSQHKVTLEAYNEVSDEHCRAIYCSKCKISIHSYKCECPEYSVKAALCKHIHAVALLEQRSENVLGPSSDHECENNDVLCVVEPTASQFQYQDELTHFIEERNSGQSSTIDFERRREIALQEVCSFARTLDQGTFNTFMVEVGKIKNHVQKNLDILCKKRRIEKQLYYPNKK